ncbi:MAG: dTMP kinase [Gemmatimonadota bacterium]
MRGDRRGLFLVFEGVEGAGKSTQVQRLVARLEERRISYLLVREPGGTPAGERIRQIVLDPELSMCAETELLLYLAARAQFVRQLVQPALERGELVIADRYELSTFAYQGVGRGLGVERARELNAFATGGLKPDAIILLTVEPEAGLARKNSEMDRLERERSAFHRTVAKAYRQLAATEPSVIVIDSGAPTEEVTDRIWVELCERWPERFEPGG